jgi:hypothetical protein
MVTARTARFIFLEHAAAVMTALMTLVLGAMAGLAMVAE